MKKNNSAPVVKVVEHTVPPTFAAMEAVIRKPNYGQDSMAIVQGHCCPGSACGDHCTCHEEQPFPQASDTPLPPSVIPVDWPVDFNIQILKNVETECPSQDALLNAYHEDHNTLMEDGKIYFGGRGGTLMPGIAIARDEETGKTETIGTTIAFTENRGFMHIGINDDGFVSGIIPVGCPVVLGPTCAPQAVMVPITSKQAIQEGIDLLNGIQAHTEFSLPSSKDFD